MNTELTDEQFEKLSVVLDYVFYFCDGVDRAGWSDSKYLKFHEWMLEYGYEILVDLDAAKGGNVYTTYAADTCREYQPVVDKDKRQDCMEAWGGLWKLLMNITDNVTDGIINIAIA